MRVKNTTTRRKKHKKIISLAKGYRLSGSSRVRVAKNRLQKAWKNAYVSRRLRKRSFKRLWNNRINAFLKNLGLSYSKVVGDLNKKKILLNKKILAELCVNYPDVFKNLIKTNL